MKALLAILLLIGTCSVAKAQSSAIDVQLEGPRNDTTMSNVFVSVSNRLVRLNYDGGEWLITNNVTIGNADTHMYVYPGTTFNVTSGVTLTINGVLDPSIGAYEIFTGSGIVTGAPVMTFEHPEWGSNFDFSSVPATSNLNYVVAGQASNIFNDLIIKDFPLYGSSLAVPSGSNQMFGAAAVDQLNEVFFWTELYGNDYSNYWGTLSNRFKPLSKSGIYNLNLIAAINGYNTNLLQSQRFEMFAVKNATNSSFAAASTEQLITLGGTLLPPAALQNSGYITGFNQINVTEPFTNTWQFFFRSSETCQVQFMAASITYGGNPALVR